MLRHIVNKVRSAITSNDRAMDRWSKDRLAAVKLYLEDKDPKNWSREDHYLSVEFVIQRYLPADEPRTQGQYDATIRDLKGKIDWNIDHPDAPKELPAEDPEFATWLREELRTKVDRNEIVRLLSFFDDEENSTGKIRALKIFKFWLEHLDSHVIDDDLLDKIKSTYSAWLTTEKIKLLDMKEITIFQCDIGDMPVQLMAYHSYPDGSPHISITPYAPTQQKFRVDFRIGLVDLLSSDETIRKAIDQFKHLGYPYRVVNFDDPGQEFQLFSENL